VNEFFALSARLAPYHLLRFSDRDDFFIPGCVVVGFFLRQVPPFFFLYATFFFVDFSFPSSGSGWAFVFPSRSHDVVRVGSCLTLFFCRTIVRVVVRRSFPFNRIRHRCVLYPISGRSSIVLVFFSVAFLVADAPLREPGNV